MQINSKDTIIEVLFDAPLDFKGVLSLGNYKLVASDGGVPLSVLSVEPIFDVLGRGVGSVMPNRFAELGNTAAMVADSSFHATLTKNNEVYLAGDSSVSAEASLAAAATATLQAGSAVAAHAAHSQSAVLPFSVNSDIASNSALAADLTVTYEREFVPFFKPTSGSPFLPGQYLSLRSSWNWVDYTQILSVTAEGTLVLDHGLMLLDPLNPAVPWIHMTGLLGVRLRVNKPTNGKTYVLAVSGLRNPSGQPFSETQSFTASALLPKLDTVEVLDDGQVVVTFTESMRRDVVLTSPGEYTITGPTTVQVQTVRSISPTQVFLQTIGLSNGDYSLEVNATGTPHDIAGNPIDPVFNAASFTGNIPITTRSVFTDKGPITKRPLILDSGATATVLTPTTVSLPTASLGPSALGLLISLTGSSVNGGTFRILSVLSGTTVRLNASFSLPDPDNGAISWEIYDPQDGIIADDPGDVTVRVNGSPVVPQAVVGLLGQIVLDVAPDPADQVDVDYCWICNPTVEFRRLNSKEFRFNNWNRDLGREVGRSQHRYRYNNTMVEPETYETLDMRAELAQPLQRDLKYRAYERAYSVAFNDPNLLLFNSPHHRIAFPPLSRPVASSFINYQAQYLPENDPVAPWVRVGTGNASLVSNELVIEDTTGGSFPTGQPIYWQRPADLTFNHVFASAWRMTLTQNPVPEGIWTGVVAGYSDESRAYIVGYLEDAGVKKFGFLKKGYGNDPSTAAAWVGGIDATDTSTFAPAEIDWDVIHSYRILKDRDGVVRLYVDGSVIETLRILPDEAPFLSELNDPFDQLQNIFFGSLSRPALNTSTWSFYRYTIQPLNPFESAPSVFVSYEANQTPEESSQPWTPVGSHGTETIVSTDYLVLDSTSASDLATEAAAGLVSGDFRGYSRIEPLLGAASDVVLDLNVAVRTWTHGVSPNAVMAAVDDGSYLTQLSFLCSRSAPKFSYGGRSLPDDFAPYYWNSLGTAPVEMVGQILRIADNTALDGRVYSLDDNELPASVDRVIGNASDWILEFRVKVNSYVTDVADFAGVMAQVYDSARAVGVMLQDVGGTKYVTLHSDGIPVAGGQFAFDWDDGEPHTYRIRKSLSGPSVVLFVDGTMIGDVNYGVFAVPVASPVGVVSFGSSTPASMEAQSNADWYYCNTWRVIGGVLDPYQTFVGLWKGKDSDSLLGYHLPVKATGGDATVVTTALGDPFANFLADGVVSGDYLIVDSGANKGVYTIANVTGATTLTITTPFPVQPSKVNYRIPSTTDWTVPHKYRLSRDPGGGIGVYLDAGTSPIISAGYNSLDLPNSSVGVTRVVADGLPSIVWGTFDTEELSQTSWDFVRFGITRAQPELGIVPHHQVMNQRNIMASYEHHRTTIAHDHTNFWSESEGIPPQTDPDFLQNPSLVAYTLLNEGTPLVPKTQTYEVRKPTPTLVPNAAFNDPMDLLNQQGLVFNDGSTSVKLLVPDDVLYNCLKVIETETGDTDLIAPFDDECNPDIGTLFFQNEVCLTYDGSVLPENDTSAPTPWALQSEDPARVSTTAFAGVLTYGTDGVGTKTLYRNATPLTDTLSLQREVTFRFRLLEDSSGGLDDSHVRVGLSSIGLTLALGFITTPLGQRYVVVEDLNNQKVVGGILFDFLDGLYHDYRLVLDPGSASVQIFIDN